MASRLRRPDSTRRVCERALLAVVALLTAASGCGKAVVRRVRDPADVRRVRDPAVVCRVREHTGPVSGTYYEHRLASDGRTVEIRLEAPGETGLDRLSYDDRGLLVRRDASHEQSAYSAPHPSSLDRQGGWHKQTVVHAYDAQGRKIRSEFLSSSQLTDGGSHGEAGVDGVDTWGPKIETYRYEAGRLVAIADDEGVWHYAYDGSRVVQARHEAHGRTTLSYDYAYDEAGRRVRSIQTADFLAKPWTFSYLYDSAGRLTEARVTVDGPSAPWQRLEYDAGGRVTRFVERDIEVLYTYDTEGRLHSIDDHSSFSPREFSYGDGCTPAITAGLLPNPLAKIMEDRWDGNLWFTE